MSLSLSIQCEKTKLMDGDITFSLDKTQLLMNTQLQDLKVFVNCL